MIDRKIISYSEAVNFLLPRHYSGRIPNIKIAFGDFVDGELKAVCTFGKPASPSLCKGICGAEFSSNVYELNRLCRSEDYKYPLSSFVSWCLREIRSFNWIVVSYSDTAMNHHGYIYQACNFLYTGATKSRTDKYTPNGKHSRHYDKNVKSNYRKYRSSKHRYVMFCTKDKKLKRLWKDRLRYNILPYPKGDNSNYVLGEYLQDTFIKTI